MHNQFWRLGYASEALLALIEQLHPFLDFHRIEVHVSLGNFRLRSFLKN
ncbi:MULTISPECIES: GNAT family N-acetyltransferase [Streptococcus]|nr:GNAT family N-acetyltransferase [Streptococcus acidominimus]